MRLGFGDAGVRSFRMGFGFVAEFADASARDFCFFCLSRVMFYAVEVDLIK
jgi:hypothetical protein